MDKTMLLFGGSNIDYIGTSDEPLLESVSNIGKVTVSFGGVMRNIAENLSRLGNQVIFVTAIGKDMLGKELKKALLELNINVFSPDSDLSTGSYLAINDSNHDMALALCDNAIIESINAKYLKRIHSFIKKHEYLCLDANLSTECIDTLFERYPEKKFIVEAISPEKVVKFKGHLSNIYLIKVNIHEAKALINQDLQPDELVRQLLLKGVGNVVLSNGSKDIYIGSSKDQIEIIPVEKVENFVNTTGCGDALTSGIIDRFLQGKSLKESVEFGIELSKMTLMSPFATSKEIEKYKHD